MKYISTRNNLKEFNFEQIFIKGLADDGGLYIPKSLKKYPNIIPKSLPIKTEIIPTSQKNSKITST